MEENTVLNNEFSGKTVEDATLDGLAILGLERDDAIVEVLEEGKRGGLFGIGNVKARVRITRKKTDGERAIAFLEGLFDLLKLDLSSTLVAEGEKIEIELNTEDEKEVKEIVGKHGEMLDAIQTLAGAVANIGRDEYKRVVVDCGNYRETREETLVKLAGKLAAKAVRLGKKVMLEPMPPYERRVIHSALAESTEVTTVSEGKEPARCVMIVPNGCDPDAEIIKESKPSFKNNRGNAKPYGKKPYRSDYNKGERKEFNRDGKPYEKKYSRDGKPYEKKYNRDGKPYEKKYNRDGKPYEKKYNRDGKPYEKKYNRDGNTSVNDAPKAAPRKKGNYFATYLGNTKEED